MTMDWQLLYVENVWEFYLMILAGLLYFIVMCVAHEKNMKIVAQNKRALVLARKIKKQLDGSSFEQEHRKLRNHTLIGMIAVLFVHVISYYFIYTVSCRFGYLLVALIIYLLFACFAIINFKMKGAKVLPDNDHFGLPF